ncbi:hypothetical protein BDF20DRAFT_832599 [Mycotypha africana]|uniref:uncharacterized protein n=1 Tax=Mycotypha africana TaxID=64632 RepID=UPI0023018AB2|nr:uncharacterized protein BDF20DRAFT_832599 [Mycotypha africana]KAI8987693.1 hypothetical protein BDF20DRAFT_832599 [Mycotypha africana]
MDRSFLKFFSISKYQKREKVNNKTDMTAQQIEFYVHPPSPVQTKESLNNADTTFHHDSPSCCITKLPSISSLLSYATDGENDSRSVLTSDLPLISLPSPSISSSRNSVILEPEPLDISSGYENSNNPHHHQNHTTAVTSPSSLSPFFGALSLIETTSPTTSNTSTTTTTTTTISSSSPIATASNSTRGNYQQQPLLSPQTSPHPSHSQLLLLPPPTNSRRSRSLSNASSVSTCSFSTIESYTSNHSTSTTTSTALPVSPSSMKVNKSHSKTKLAMTSTTPYIKRKRGRPPNTSLFQTSPSLLPVSSSHHQQQQQQTYQPPQQGHHFIETHLPGQQQNGGNQLTFLTPTVWNVKGKEVPPPSPSSGSGNTATHSINTNDWPASSSSSSSSPPSPFTTMHASSLPSQPSKQPAQISHADMNTTTLDLIPTKKRGRRPKVQLAGNFCFVWRDLTAKRGANKKKILKQQQQTTSSSSKAVV